MNSVVTVEDGTKNWITVNQQSVSVIASNNTISVLGSKQGIQGIQGDTAPLTETTPFGAGAFTNGEFVDCRGIGLAIGTHELYTVPAGKRFAVNAIAATNPTGSSINQYLKIKIGGVYYRITGTTAISASFFSGTISAGIILEAGETLAIETSSANGLSVFASGILFDESSALKTVKLVGLSSGENTLYTVPPGKSATILFTGAWDLSTLSSVSFVADAGGTRTVTPYHVLSGEPTATSNQIRTPTAVTALTRNGLTIQCMVYMQAGSSIVINVDTGNSAQMAWINLLEI